MATVQLSHVTKKIGQQLILDDVSLSIEKGEFLVIVGPSGCGKSTLLRLIAGLDVPTSGSIAINHQCVSTLPAAKRDMAMVFQSYALYPHMTVFQNMAYGLKMRGYAHDVIQERVAEVAAMLLINACLNKKPRALSGGQRQRVAMGRAIVRSPAVFLFDEPLSNLDAKLRAEMRYEIKKIHQTLNTTCIYVTHDQTEAMTMATRIVILNHGKIEQEGSPHSIYHEPASLFAANFTGHYPTNLLPGMLDVQNQRLMIAEGLSVSTPALAASISSDLGVVMAIRPEHVQLTSMAQDPTAIPVECEFIDDMGADKLLHSRTRHGQIKMTVRISSDQTIDYDNLGVRLMLDKMNLFHEKTGINLGLT